MAGFIKRDPASSEQPHAEAGTRVLLMGYRKALGDALTALGVPFVVWNDGELKVPPVGVKTHIGPYGNTAAGSRELASVLRNEGRFTHVIAGTEASVVAASHARRVLGARLSTHTTARRCHDKLSMKRALQKHDVPMADFVDGNKVRSWRRLRQQLGSPIVVKNRRSSGGDGIDVVGEADGPKVRLHNRIAERFIDAPEASVESFVVDGSVVFDNVTEYYRKQHINIVPAGGRADRPDGIRDINAHVIDALRISWGTTHMEAYLCPAGPLFGEIALRPPGGYIMDLISLAYGFDAWQAFVSVELGLPFAFPAAPSSVAAAVVLHPGAGRVTRIEGQRALRDHPCVARFRLRVQVGDRIEARRSVGKEVGHLLLSAPDRKTLLAALDDVEATLQIEVDPTRMDGD